MQNQEWKREMRLDEVYLRAGWLAEQAGREDLRKFIMAFPFGVIATDGYVMVRVANREERRGCPLSEKPVAVDAEEAKTVADLLKKWKIEDCDAVYNPDEHTVTFRNPHTHQEYKCRATEGGLPNFDRILPEGEPLVTFTVPVKSIVRIAKTLEKMGADEWGYLTFRWYGQRKPLTVCKPHENGALIEFLCYAGTDAEVYPEKMEKWFEDQEQANGPKMESV